MKVSGGLQRRLGSNALVSHNVIVEEVGRGLLIIIHVLAIIRFSECLSVIHVGYYTYISVYDMSDSATHIQTHIQMI